MNDTEIIKDFDELLNCFILIGNKLDGGRIASGQELLYNAEGLGQKIVQHSITIRVLYEGYQLRGFVETVDFASIAVLARSIFETYLVFHYLFVEDVDSDTRDFRIESWFLGGLDRVKYRPAFESDLEKWESENIKAEEHKTKIRATQFFQNLRGRNKANIINGKWQYKQWHEMATSAGFSESFFRQTYMFLSSYAHSNRLSVIQIQQYKKRDDQQDIAAAFIAIILTVIAKYAYDYLQIMPGLKDKIDLNLPDFRLIKTYKDVGETIQST